MEPRKEIINKLNNYTELRDYQKNVIEEILNDILKNRKESLIEMATGSGKTYTLCVLIDILINCNIYNKIVLLVPNKSCVEHFNILLRKFFKLNEKVYINTFREFICNTNVFDDIPYNAECVICDEIDYIKDYEYQYFVELFKSSHFILTSSDTKKNEWLSRKNKTFSYTLSNMLDSGYINPKDNEVDFDIFWKKFFAVYDLKDIHMYQPYETEEGRRIIRPDIIIEYKNEILLFEIKEYRNNHISYDVINKAISQIKNYKEIVKGIENKEVKPYLILLCEIEERIKEKIYKELDIVILDISNILYLCQIDEYLMNKLLERIPYSVQDIIAKAPIDTGEKNSLNAQMINHHSNQELDTPEDLIKRILACETGMEYSKEYENICSDIIEYLFKSEFTQMSNQHRTEDSLFRMDLLCGLKGSTEFWKSMIKYYNSKFVVFEYKNYSEKLEQNLIYITEKYLFDIALRNVAIIISREGFSENAKKATIGSLVEKNKLILELTDEDLIYMIRLKMDGEEPSDHLLEKWEKYLMSISK